MKRPIEWHQECLKNFRDSINKEIRERDEMISRVEMHIFELQFYEKQINEAIKKKKDGFDEDKFLKGGKNKGGK
jgi:hypothetical protein